MTDGIHEGGSGNADPYIVFGLDREVTRLPNGKAHLSEVIGYHDMSSDDIRETTAAVYSVDPDLIMVHKLDGEPYPVSPAERREARRRGSVAFTEWNSPWVPGADSDHKED
jgi:hypothetical protein